METEAGGPLGPTDQLDQPTGQSQASGRLWLKTQFGHCVSKTAEVVLGPHTHMHRHEMEHPYANAIILLNPKNAENRFYFLFFFSLKDCESG